MKMPLSCSIVSTLKLFIQFLDMFFARLLLKDDGYSISISGQAQLFSFLLNFFHSKQFSP